jgi:hypothetical protein
MDKFSKNPLPYNDDVWVIVNKRECENYFNDALDRVTHYLKSNNLVVPTFVEYQRYWILEYAEKDKDIKRIIKMSVNIEEITKCSKILTHYLSKTLEDSANYESDNNNIDISTNETTEETIKRLLEPLRNSFGEEDNKKVHIDKISKAFIDYKNTNKSITEIIKPDYQAVKLTDDFLRPFWQLYEKGIFKRSDIGAILLMFIQPVSVSKSNFEPGYILKRISQANPNSKKV